MINIERKVKDINDKNKFHIITILIIKLEQ